ncbi:cytochrome c oxidase subunit I [Alienimonas chondri]|uniref:Cytochrome c oxidase subunit 1 n=1 Tax=Alienimonas chondri TaxID=2681879 RepID=A0ABX1V9P6_9PLAN|nr:cytochrome c oxidase subunit I [Alienimonas chondri]NNJ24819.1 Cytochrome c oxidase polypeptide I+III [Alienimonas chondri]
MAVETPTDYAAGEAAPSPERAAVPAGPPGYAEDNYLNHTKGLMSWLVTLDHKRIGMMYLVGVMSAFLLGGIFALLVRAELWTPGETIVTAETYNRFFTLHGAIMVFLFIIPSVPAALGNFVLPVMLGAKDVAFPRMNLASFYLWCGGAIFFLITLFRGSLDTGWTFYVPYSTSTETAVVTALTGVFILGFSSIFTGLNFIVTVHTMRPPGMEWFKMPLFLWAIYATSIIQVLATPVLAVTLLLLAVERTTGIGVFDPAYGGDPVLFQHFFWFYSHPAVYIMILPGFGIISELISTFSRKHIFGYRFIAYSSIAIALFGFLVWGHHMFTSGMSTVAAFVFSLLTFSVSIPSAIKVFNWLATMYKGNIWLATPMCYALSFIFLFTIGGLTGLHLGALATDIHLHDSYFVVSHFHYVMVGGSLVAFLGGLFYWWPKMTGKMYNDFWGKISALIVFLAFNLTFFPQFILGTKGMPRRYYNYVPEFQFWHQVSTVGAFMLGGGLLVAAVVLVHSLLRGKKAPANPWGAATLEWQCSSPPPHNNFDHPPTVGDPYALNRVVYDPDTRSYRQIDEFSNGGTPQQTAKV